MEEILERWSDIGFTDGLEGNKLENVVMAFETAAKFIVNSNSDKYKEIETIVFPIIRRVFQKVEEKLGNTTIQVFTIKLLGDLNEQYKALEIPKENPGNIDYEAVFCAAFSDNYKLEL